MEEDAGFRFLGAGEPAKGPYKQKNGVSPRQDDGTGLSSSTSSDGLNKREEWAKSADFFLSCVGFAVGLGNVWRFPYLCYKNGGGVFLIPYVLFGAMGGVPLFFLEICTGQYMGISGIKVWNVAPILKGIGYATTVIVFFLNCYYIVILAWDGFYLVETLAYIGYPLPWSTCGHYWNTENCTTKWSLEACRNETIYSLNSTISGFSEFNETCQNISTKGSDSATEYWRYRILQISSGVDNVGGIVWELALSLLIFWVICYFCIWKGVQWTGKVVYFTATFPYVVITILLIRGVTLEGAAQGIMFYLKPDFSRLSDINVWIDAGSQIFFSYAVSLGAWTALGSYNKYNNNSYRQVIIISVINCGTSFYAGFAIFSVLGYMAHVQGIDISAVTESGPGLAFIAYPTAVSTIPVVPHLWAVLFFVMIIFVGLDSQFVGVEAFVTTMVDIFPTHLRKPYRREIFTALYCAVSYLVGLTMVTNGGAYVFELFNYYSASGLALLWVGFFECVAVAWLYGSGRFYGDLEIMFGFRLNPWFRVCWLVLTPLVTSGLFMCMWIDFSGLRYNQTYVYPVWAQGVGMCMAFASMLCIPGYALYAMIRAKGSLKQRWKFLTTPVLGPRQSQDFYKTQEETRRAELELMVNP